MIHHTTIIIIIMILHSELNTNWTEITECRRFVKHSMRTRTYGPLVFTITLIAWTTFLLQKHILSRDSRLTEKSDVQLSGDFEAGEPQNRGRAREDEEEVYQLLAYHLVMTDHDVESLSDLFHDEFLGKKARWLAHQLRSLGVFEPADMVYYLRLFQFAHDYNMDASILYERLVRFEPAISWRYFCYRYISLARLWKLPPVSAASDKEAVFLETRVFPHVEFVIRNVIKNLGSGWMLTIVCSGENESLMTAIASAISSKIRVIRLERSFVSVNDYNNLLLTVEYWKDMRGEKLLIFQEDSILFSRGLDIFLPYDYVGSPWLPISVEDVAAGVGNGGLSLRSKSVMIEILETCDVGAFSPSDNVQKAMAYVGLTKPPEDVFFAHMIESHGIGKLAPRELAMLLVEHTAPDDFNAIIGGHQFWHAMPNATWLKYAVQKLLVQSILPLNMT